MTVFFKTLFFSLLLATATLFISCDTEDPYAIDYSMAPEPFEISEDTEVETESGLIYYVVEEGNGGDVVSRRSRIKVFYTGRTMDGDIFDSSYRNGSIIPVTFNDLGSLVKGFREGVMGMQEGEKRVLIIPPALGYGGSPSHHLSDDTLRFDVELDELIY